MRPYIIALITALAMASAAACGGGGGPPPFDVGDSESVTYQAEDGVVIAASWVVPPDQARPPVVILFHELEGSRDQWDKFIPVLVNEGYAVLTPDLRSFGESTRVVRDGGEELYELTDLDEMLLDVDAALKWLGDRSDVDLDRVGIIGAGDGGNLAYVSTAVFPEVKTAIAMTPRPYSEDGRLVGNGIPNFLPHDVFFVAGGREAWIDAVSLAIRVAGTVDGGPYADETVQGVALLAEDDVLTDMIAWLGEHL